MEQAFIQVRVDADLKDEATRTLEKIGMDMPNAIRMFLKRIVIEGGLPFEARLPRAEDAEKRNESRAVCIPAQSVLHVPMEEYIELLCMVPKGKITRRDDIEKYLQKKHGAERVMIDMRPLYANPLWEGIPIWREVSTRGMLIESLRMSRERQRELLEADGLKVVECGANKASLRVEHYKEMLIDFETMESDHK